MKLVPSLFALPLISASLASAATITQTATFSGTPTYSGFRTFNQFNSSLGTLTSITITTGVTSTGGRYSIDNDSATVGDGTVTLGAMVSITSGDVRQAGVSSEASTTVSLNVAADDGDLTTYSTDGPDSASYTGGSVSSFNEKTVGSTVHGDYVGTGTYNLDFTSNQINSSTSFSGIQTQIDPVQSNGYITVTYNYTAAIPEPASALLGGLGLLTLLRRRRR
jgi:hypothetical protein